MNQQSEPQFGLENTAAKSGSHLMKYILEALGVLVVISVPVLIFFLKQHNQKLAEEIDTMQSNIPEVPIADQSSDWQAYRNEEYGFEFEHPSDFEEFTVGGKIFFEAENRGQISFNIHNRKLNTQNILDVEGKVHKSELHKIDGRNWYVFRIPGEYCGSSHFQTDLPQNVFELVVSTCQNDASSFTDQDINQILSTFKFVGSVPEEMLEAAKKFISAHSIKGMEFNV